MRLPRPVCLGLGLPLARPGRSAMTVAAVAFGMAAVTFAVGLDRTEHLFVRTCVRMDTPEFGSTAG
jgi:putative ABC transport system permease protein